MNYFSLFDIAPSYELDLTALEQAYFIKQQQYHPDRLVGKSDEERSKAIQLSMDINQGYHALKDAILRAQHLLVLQGVYVNTERDNIKPSPMLLMEMMEWREEIEGSTFDMLAEHQQKAETMKSETIDALSQQFANQQWQEAAQSTLKLQYLSKVMDDIKLHRKHKGAA
jgi:molecular chaperone HscB